MFAYSSTYTDYTGATLDPDYIQVTVELSQTYADEITNYDIDLAVYIG